MVFIRFVVPFGNNRHTDLMKNLWRLWAKALGEKSGASSREADRIALIRTLIIISYFVTNLFIIASVIRHW